MRTPFQQQERIGELELSLGLAPATEEKAAGPAISPVSTYAQPNRGAEGPNSTLDTNLESQNLAVAKVDVSVQPSPTDAPSSDSGCTAGIVDKSQTVKAAECERHGKCYPKPVRIPDTKPSRYTPGFCPKCEAEAAAYENSFGRLLPGERSWSWRN